MKGKALIRPALKPRTVDLCIVMDGARVPSVTAWEIMKGEEWYPLPGFGWQRGGQAHLVLSQCPEQLPGAVFQSRAFCCVTASL